MIKVSFCSLIQKYQRQPTHFEIRDHQQRLLHSVIGPLKGRNSISKQKKLLFHQEKAPFHKSVKRMTKTHKLGFELFPHPPYSDNKKLFDALMAGELTQKILSLYGSIFRLGIAAETQQSRSISFPKMRRIIGFKK